MRNIIKVAMVAILCISYWTPAWSLIVQIDESKSDWSITQTFSGSLMPGTFVFCDQGLIMTNGIATDCSGGVRQIRYGDELIFGALNTITFRSDAAGPASPFESVLSPADTGTPLLPAPICTTDAPCVYILEPQSPNQQELLVPFTETFTYRPIAGQPGFNTSTLFPGPVTYIITSDSSVPEPATIALLSLGIVGIWLGTKHA